MRPALEARRARRVAVVLNANARRVGDETVGWVRGVVPSEDLYLSRSLADGARIAGDVLARGYDVVMWGGGDGTFCHGVAATLETARRRGHRRVPAFGVLGLGTGNAIAHAIGAGPATAEGLGEDLRRARAGGTLRALHMLEVDGRPTLFAGFGLDSMIQEDFAELGQNLKAVGLDEQVRSAGVRYFLSVATKSVPRFLFAQRAEVIAINRGGDAIRVDVDGQPVGAPIPEGRVLWRGQATLASAGAIPFYGLGMKMFPHAERQPGRFHLRLSDMGTAEALVHLPAIWKGRYQSQKLHDFLCDKVELVLSRPSPFQSGGDLIDSRERVTIGMWPKPVSVV